MTQSRKSPWMKALSGNPLKWLLQKSNPCVRYRTLTDICELPASNAEVTKAREAIWRDPLVKTALDALDDVKPFTKNMPWDRQGLFKKHRGDLDALYRMGIPSGHPSIEAACDRWLDVEIPPQSECYPKQMIGGLVRYADHSDTRLKRKIDYVIQNEPFADGNRPGILRYGSRGDCCGSHSCYSAAIRSLWAVMGIPEEERSQAVDMFMAKGAAFLAAHRLYQPSHGPSKPIKKEWLSLRQPFGLGWQTDLLDILDVASQVGLKEDPCMLDALSELLSKQTAKGRWCVETIVPYDTGRLAGVVKDADPEGSESKWVTLSALKVLKRCEALLPAVEAGETSPVPDNSSQSTFADYPFKYVRADEERVMSDWQELGMDAVLDGLLAFKKEHRLLTGWHWGFVLGPKSCPEWCSAVARWVPRKGFTKSWPVARIFFLSGAKQFTAEGLAKRLGIPVEDERGDLKKVFWPSLWRVRIAKWRKGYDEVGVTIRSPKEFTKLKPVMEEALGALAKTGKAST